MKRSLRWLSGIVIVCTALAVALGAQAPTSPAADLVRVRLATGNATPKVEKQVLPIYPAQTPAIDGVIDIDVVVGTNGRVLHTRVVRSIASEPGLAATCIKVLSTWQFKAASISGRVVPSLISVQFEFVPGAKEGTGRVSAQLKLLPRVAAPARATLGDLPILDLMQLPATPPAGSGLVYPTPVVRVLPEYTPAAIKARIQGAVELDIVILPDGTVGAASIRRSLDAANGLDGEALIAARYWRFIPATRDGTPIAVTSRLILDFALE